MFFAAWKVAPFAMTHGAQNRARRRNIARLCLCAVQKERHTASGGRDDVGMNPTQHQMPAKIPPAKVYLNYFMNKASITIGCEDVFLESFRRNSVIVGEPEGWTRFSDAGIDRVLTP